jgi:hypothetical protein
MTKKPVIVAAAAMMPKIQKTHFQLRYSLTTPPFTVLVYSRMKRLAIRTKMFPITPPKGAPAPKQPNARSFALPGGKVVPRMPNAVGNIAAAASPAKPRRTSKPISFGINGVTIAKIVKHDEPQRKISRRP